MFKLYIKHRQFTKHYKTYKNKIFQFLYIRLGGNRELAEDLTSETFIKAYEKYDTYDQSKPFSAWVYAIARNIFIDFLRKNRVVIDIEEINVLEDTTALPDELADIELSYKYIETYIHTLPPIQRECVFLRYIDDLTHADIADIVGKSEDNIRQIISRAIRSLRKQLN